MLKRIYFPRNPDLLAYLASAGERNGNREKHPVSHLKLVAVSRGTQHHLRKSELTEN